MEPNVFIRGLVTIKQDDMIYADNVPNKFTNQGLSGILSGIASYGVSNGAYSQYWWYLPSTTWSMYIGTNTATATTPAMIALTNPIGAAPGTAPNTKAISVKNGTTDGIWAVTWSCVWTAGTVTGTLGEVALYLQISQNMTYKWQPNNYNGGVFMTNRLSSADGEFTSFAIDNTKPLSIDWKIQFSFN